MNKQTGPDKHKGAHLRSYQKHFIESFLAPQSGRTQLLQAPPGSGITHTITELIRLMFERHKARKVLVFVPTRAFGEQMVAVLNEFGVNALDVDRYRYRELEAETDKQQSPWSLKGVYVLTVSLAGQPDVMEALLGETWDLLLVHGIESADGQLADIVHSFIPKISASRVLLTYSLNKETSWPARFPDAQVTSWHGILNLSPPILKILKYERSAEELAIRSELKNLLSVAILKSRHEQSWIAVLEALASSSPVALEASLRLLKYRLKTKEVFRDPIDVEQDHIVSSESVWTKPAEALNALDKFLERLESLRRDTKMEALSAAISALRDAYHEVPKVCIFTNFVANVEYLDAALSELGLPVRKYHGSLTLADRTRALDEFAQGSGVLIATSALGNAVALPEVSSVVFYDIPISKTRLEHTLAQFNRLGRQKPLEVIVLAPSSPTIGETKALEIITQLTSRMENTSPSTAR